MPYKDKTKQLQCVKAAVENHYDKNRTKISDYKKKYYIFKKECKRLAEMRV